MAKKIIILSSSPRKYSNTRVVAEWFAEGARQGGAEVESVDLAKLKCSTSGCIACMGCQKSDKYECVIADEAQPLLARLPEFDAIVFATPVYFFGPTAQLKVVMDRMFSLFKMDPQTHQFATALKCKYGLIATAGGPYEGGLNITEQTFKMMSEFVKSSIETVLVAETPHEDGQIEENQNLKNKTIEQGRAFVQA